MRIRKRSGREAERYVGEKLKEREADAIFLPRYKKVRVRSNYILQAGLLRSPPTKIIFLQAGLFSTP